MSKTYFSYVFRLHPWVPGSKPLKPLEFPLVSMIKVSFVMLMRQLLESPQVTYQRAAGFQETVPHLWVDSDRLKLNSQTTCWCPRTV